MEQFFTRQLANDGIKYELENIDGSPSQEWLIIRGVDSDEFRLAEAEAQRNMILIASIEDPMERNKAAEACKVLTLTSLIKDWSFDLELTQENKLKLLTEAPQIAKKINVLAGQRNRLIQKKSTPSTSGQKQNSNFKEDQKIQK